MQQVQQRKKARLRVVSLAEAQALAQTLHATIKGEVRFDKGSRALYATDGSNYRQIPIGVVIPKDVEDVVATIAICQRHDVPLLPRGGGTSLAGQSCNVAVVLDMSKYLNTILEVDPIKRQARVQPGVILDHLRDAAEVHHLTFAPDPATHSQCTLGGMIGNNSCGVHSVMAGMTSENIEELEILTYDGLRMRVGATSEEQLEEYIRAGGRKGEIYAGLKALRDKYADLIRARFPAIPRRVSGYALDQLLPENGFNVARALVGTEGTCVTILEATTRLVSSPPARALLVLGYPDAFSAADHVTEIQAYGPIGLEGFDARLVENVRRKRLQPENIKLLPEGNGWLLVEFGGETAAEATAQASNLMAELQRASNPPTMKLVNKEEAARIWSVREAALAATVFVPGEPLGWEGWEDAAVPPAKLGGYLRDLRDLMNRYNYISAFYGHFGQGCVHTRINFDLTSRDGISKFRSFMEEAADLVVHYGGSISGEHGDGQARAELLPKMFGEELVQAFREFKAIWDPQGRMNPGKVVDPYGLDENLRLGPTYNPPHLKTHFQFPDDGGSFATATLRCVGVGKCRRTEGGTMCPSYKVTREEEHTTRGRAHLLFEMLQGEVLQKGWRDPHVKEALDLCLACKGCKGDCPVNVDIATYKAEFLAHYYQGRLRPRSSYAMGLIYWWARLASRLPRLANFFSHAPLFAPIAKWAAGVAPQRQMPTFTTQTFKQWFRQRPIHNNEERPQVLLWPDTFNNYFHPEVAQAAVEVLEAAGYNVIIPTQTLCCGRPLYDHGMLKTAKHLLKEILNALAPQISAGVPLVGLEPSCVAVFRDELLNLFPHDENARRLSRQTFLLSEFLLTKATHFQPPTLQRKALVQGHCHHKAIAGMQSELALLRKIGLECEIPETGCCGMAGAFGFEEKHYELSMQCGERALLPAVREAADDTLIIANGFSCQEQIGQGTARQPLHLAQVLQLALREGEAR